MSIMYFIYFYIKGKQYIKCRVQRDLTNGEMFVDINNETVRYAQAVQQYVKWLLYTRIRIS